MKTSTNKIEFPVTGILQFKYLFMMVVVSLLLCSPTLYHLFKPGDINRILELSMLQAVTCYACAVFGMLLLTTAQIFYSSVNALKYDVLFTKGWLNNPWLEGLFILFSFFTVVIVFLSCVFSLIIFVPLLGGYFMLLLPLAAVLFFITAMKASRLTKNWVNHIEGNLQHFYIRRFKEMLLELEPDLSDFNLDIEDCRKEILGTLRGSGYLLYKGAVNHLESVQKLFAIMPKTEEEWDVFHTTVYNFFNGKHYIYLTCRYSEIVIESLICGHSALQIEWICDLYNHNLEKIESLKS